MNNSFESKSIDIQENIDEIYDIDNLDCITQIVFSYISIGGDKCIDIINKIINLHGKDFLLNFNFKYWTSPLNYAIFLREEEISLFLIDLGFDVNYIDSRGNTSINYVIGSYQYNINDKTKNRQNKELLEVLKKLLFKGANIFHKNTITDLYPVYEALINSYIDSYQLIKKKIDLIKINIEICPKFKEDLEVYLKFHSGQNNGTVLRFYELIDLITDDKEKDAIKFFEKNLDVINCIEHNGQNSLFYAIDRNMKSLCKKLIDSGIDYQRCNIRNANILDVASILKDDPEGMMKFLMVTIKNKVNSDIENKKKEKFVKEIKSKLIENEILQKKLIEEEESKALKIKENNLKKKKLRKDKLEKKKQEVLVKRKEEERLENERIDKIKAENLKKKIEHERLLKIKQDEELLMIKKLNDQKIEKERIEREERKLIRSKKDLEKKRLRNLKKILQMKLDPFENFIHESEKNVTFWDTNSDPIETY